MREETFLDGAVRLILGDCREVLPTLGKVDAVVTDPPYPNGQDFFLSGVQAARDILISINAETVLWFWSEVEIPVVAMPLVATHIWHRTNVNGKIYEPKFSL